MLKAKNLLVKLEFYHF